MNKKRSRTYIIAGVAGTLVLLLAYAFWPRPMLVDMGEAVVAQMRVTVDEEGKTRVKDTFVVSSPIAGRLLRVGLEPGDTVVAGKTAVVKMRPSDPPFLDAQTIGQVQGIVNAAAAAANGAKADVTAAHANLKLATADAERTRRLEAAGAASQADLDAVEQGLAAARAGVNTADATLTMRQAELASARAKMQTFQDVRSPDASAPIRDRDTVVIHAPVNGRVLTILQESETTVAAGTPILEIGDVTRDLEVVTELLSTDAVKVSAGSRVIIEKWGGATPLTGVVERIEPTGFTKVSALGVEEQRVNTVIKLVDPVEIYKTLGHGFRVETRIVIWEDPEALTTPSSALFRQGEGWAVFVVDGGTARIRTVTVGHNNGLQAEILDGLKAGEKIVLYPGPDLQDGSSVALRQT